MKRFLIIGGTLLVVLIVFIVMKMGKGNAGIEVVTEKAQKRSITETVAANGKVQPEVQVKISSDVSGEIVELRVKEGDTVKKGDLLLRIDPIIYQSTVQRMQATLNNSRANLSNSKARLEQTEAQFANAESSYNRNKKLFDQGAISAADFDAAKAQYEGAKADVKAATESVNGAQYTVGSTEASLKEASDNLAKTTIFAPVSGTISKLNVEKGERVVGTSQMAGTELLIIANLQEMEVQVDVNENDILRVKLNDTANVEVDAHSGRVFKGVVTEVANSASTTGLTTDQVTNFPVKVRILRESYADLISADKPNEYPFRPGMSATVDIMTKSVQNVITVPIGAVTTRMDSTKGKSAKKDDKEMASGENNDDGPNNDLEVKSANDKGGDTKKKTTNTKPLECVFILAANGTAKLVPVKTGIQDTEYIQIVSGLKEGDEVITWPYSAVSRDLYQGARVEKTAKSKMFQTTSK